MLHKKTSHITKELWLTHCSALRVRCIKFVLEENKSYLCWYYSMPMTLGTHRMSSSWDIHCHPCYIRGLPSTNIIGFDPRNSSDVCCEVYNRSVPKIFFPPACSQTQTQKYSEVQLHNSNKNKLRSEHAKCKCSPLIQRSARRLLCTVNICCNEYKVRSLSLWPSRSSRLKWVSCFHIFIYKDVKDAFFQVFIPLTQHDVAPLLSWVGNLSIWHFCTLGNGLHQPTLQSQLPGLDVYQTQQIKNATDQCWNKINHSSSLV